MILNRILVLSLNRFDLVFDAASSVFLIIDVVDAMLEATLGPVCKGWVVREKKFPELGCFSYRGSGQLLQLWMILST